MNYISLIHRCRNSLRLLGAWHKRYKNRALRQQWARVGIKYISTHREANHKEKEEQTLSNSWPAIRYHPLLIKAFNFQVFKQNLSLTDKNQERNKRSQQLINTVPVIPLEYLLLFKTRKTLAQFRVPSFLVTTILHLNWKLTLSPSLRIMKWAEETNTKVNVTPTHLVPIYCWYFLEVQGKTWQVWVSVWGKNRTLQNMTTWHCWDK